MEPENSATLSQWLELREQMHAAELLLEDLQFAPAELATYWALSAELLALLQEINEYLERRRFSFVASCVGWGACGHCSRPQQERARSDVWKVGRVGADTGLPTIRQGNG